jgi:2-(1,2-epoxy-1,2-dihydrophenyl)acetyl-CoA isomerase
VEPAEVDAATEELLERLVSGPTIAIGLTKQGLHYAQHSTLPQAMTQELFNLELSCRTADFKEGLAAFTQRRPPGFTGR